MTLLSGSTVGDPDGAGNLAGATVSISGGFLTGDLLSVTLTGPSRDLLVKRSTPANASGRVYGVVYAGLDIGQAIAPLIFGRLMDHGQYTSVLIGLAVVQGVLIVSAFNVRRVRRESLVPASA